MSMSVRMSAIVSKAFNFYERRECTILMRDRKTGPPAFQLVTKKGLMLISTAKFLSWELVHLTCVPGYPVITYFSPGD